MSCVLGLGLTAGPKSGCLFGYENGVSQLMNAHQTVTAQLPKLSLAGLISHYLPSGIWEVTFFWLSPTCDLVSPKQLF